MNELERYFRSNKGSRIHKWNHYFEIYDRHLAPYRGREVNVLEFGVSHGGSLQMWKHYFGSEARIFGVDINPDCKRAEEERIRVFIGDQADRDFLRKLPEEIGRIDILIDDGGHTMEQQINTFEELFPRVETDGIYLAEDLHTSYWEDFGGGYRTPGTFIEYSKNFIDALHAWHSTGPEEFKVTDFTRSVHSLHYYDSILVIEKRAMREPTREKIGKGRLPRRGSLFR
ncbi:MAG: class I SAM-dependent methyltransferase [Gammaproteobacteria bacterium]|nr:class I SAM-dependent methyltransferase [Gammaproteobacteria bacterium]